jgi:hypothetical protein
MKLVIEAEEGELEEKLEEAISALRSCANGHDHRLCKAAGTKVPSDQEPRRLATPALQESVERSEAVVERIRRVMVRRIEELLKRAV